MRLPPGMRLRIELIGGADAVEIVVAGVVRAGGVERARELSRVTADDAMGALRIARDWLTARLVAEAEEHAPTTPPVFESERVEPEETPF